MCMNDSDSAVAQTKNQTTQRKAGKPAHNAYIVIICLACLANPGVLPECADLDKHVTVLVLRPLKRQS